MDKLNYTLENLRKLMSASPAYQNLDADQKANIEEHIRINNKPVLLFIYQKLAEESEVYQNSRENLAKKVLKFDDQSVQQIKSTLKNNPPLSEV